MNSKNIILHTALNTLKVEKEVLNEVLNSIGDDFVVCVETIFNCKGRLVLTGIGKSALVAQKIVATLNSTGTPALFMHAADAIHGDLGMVRTDDIIICISKSGETAEIKVLVPLVKQLGNIIIGMVSNEHSFLAKQAHFLLHIPVKQEADPLNLAPTASTTAQMAMGDALATALLAVRGFSPNDFAQYHPGGTLGKQLYLRVNNIFPLNERPIVYESTLLQDAIMEITTKRLGATVVVDKDGRPIGIVTDGDLRRMLSNKNWDMNQKASEVMTFNPVTIHKDALAIEALNIMRDRSITQLVVIDNENKYLGMVHLHDLIREGIV